MSHHLCSRAVEAHEAGDAAEADRLFAVQRSFFDQHILVWMPRFCEEALKRVSTPYYRNVCEALSALVEEERTFFG